MLQVGVVTLFPEMLDLVREYGVTGRAVKNGLVEIACYNPRDYAPGPHRRVDDRPYGGGPGMVMMVQPLKDAIAAARRDLGGAKVIYLSPQGKRLDQQAAAALATEETLILSFCMRRTWWETRLFSQPSVVHSSWAGMRSPSRAESTARIS